MFVCYFSNQYTYYQWFDTEVCSASTSFTCSAWLCVKLQCSPVLKCVFTWVGLPFVDLQHFLVDMCCIYACIVSSRDRIHTHMQTHTHTKKQEVNCKWATCQSRKPTGAGEMIDIRFLGLAFLTPAYLILLLAYNQYVLTTLILTHRHKHKSYIILNNYMVRMYIFKLRAWRVKWFFPNTTSLKYRYIWYHFNIDVVEHLCVCF